MKQKLGSISQGSPKLWRRRKPRRTSTHLTRQTNVSINHRLFYSLPLGLSTYWRESYQVPNSYGAIREIASGRLVCSASSRLQKLNDWRRLHRLYGRRRIHLETTRPERLMFGQRVVAVRTFRASERQLGNTSISSWQSMPAATKEEFKRRSGAVGVTTVRAILLCGAYSSRIW